MSLSHYAPWLLPVLLLAGCQTPGAFPSAELAVEAGASSWKPLLLESASAVRPAAPQGSLTAELDELKAWQARRSEDDAKAIAYWNGQAATLRWAELTREAILKKNMVPPRAARALALVHAAMYDAVIASWEAKAAYRRAAPADPQLKPLVADSGIPSYPSEHAAVAMAAAETLAHLIPEEKDAFKAKALAAAETRVAAGANFRSDVTAGLGIGSAVAERAIARARADGSDAKPVLPLQVQPGQWTHTAPMEPLAGNWQTWMVASGAQFQLSAPAAPTQAQIDEVKRVSGAITDAEREKAKYWNFDVPAVIWTERAEGLLAAKKTSTPRAARVLGYLNTLMADSFVTCWATKYVALRPRPVHLANGFQSVFPTPPHPSYPSGHATCSAAAAVYLGAVFPEDAAVLTAEAEEAAMSRLWAGIHYREDNDDGLALGRRLGAFVLEKARADGLP